MAQSTTVGRGLAQSTTDSGLLGLVGQEAGQTECLAVVGTGAGGADAFSGGADSSGVALAAAAVRLFGAAGVLGLVAWSGDYRIIATARDQHE